MDLDFLKQLLPSGLRGWIRDKRIEFLPDWRYMDRIALPVLAARRPNRVLNVGIQRYNISNAGVFERAGAEYWTTDIRPESTVYGARNRHLVANVTEIDQQIAPRFFDIVILNGVFGHGINDVPSQERTISAIEKILTADGELVVGWNPGMSIDPCELTIIKKSFTHGGIPGLPERIDFRKSNHTFDFFTVRAGMPPQNQSVGEANSSTIETKLTSDVGASQAES